MSDAHVDEAAIERALLEVLAARAAGASACPSEVARAVAVDGNWRHLMEPVRATVRRLVARGIVEVTRKGRVVDPERVRGPIRVRLRSPGRAR
jgi:hypothetical protein